MRHETHQRLSNANDVHLDIARGVVLNFINFQQIGHHAGVGQTATFVSALGGANPYFPTTPVFVEAISTSANDTLAGTGARTIRVIGIGPNWEEQTADIELNGLTASAATSVQFRRVHIVYVLTAGTYGGTNVGLITVRASGGGTAFCGIYAGFGKSTNASYTVPVNKRIYLTDLHFSSEANKVVRVNLWYRPDADVVAAPYAGKQLFGVFDIAGGGYDLDYKHAPIQVMGKSDIWATAFTPSTTAAVSVEGIFEIMDEYNASP